MDRSGRTPLEMADKYDLPDIVQMINRRICK